MKFKELKDTTAAELRAQEAELRQELLNLRVQQASGQLENSARLRHVRKDIARILTRISQLEGAAAAK